MKSLIVFYSYSGNTARIAEMICKKSGGDLARIEMVTPYTGDYDAVVKQGQREVNEGYMPDITSFDADLSQYDRIFLGTPVWWYTFAPPVKTFLTQNSFAGKRVYPFITNGGWIGHTVKDIAAACPGAKLDESINVRFDGSDLSTPVTEINHWIETACQTK